MDFLQAVFLGIVEGLTEFLPVSSTAHLMMAAKALEIEQSGFVKSFEIAIQLGAILAVVFLYGKIFLRSIEVWKKVIAAFLPTGIIGFLAYKAIKSFLLESYFTVFWTLFLGGIFIIVFEFFLKRRNEGGGGGSLSKEETSVEEEIKFISYKEALIIGTVQALAVVPGVSRSAATIIAGLFLGIKKKAIVEFSFLLAVPTMLAATVYDAYKNFSLFYFSGGGKIIVVGFVVSFIFAVLSVKFFLGFIKKKDFTVFGIYRIIIALTFLLIFLV